MKDFKIFFPLNIIGLFLTSNISKLITQSPRQTIIPYSQEEIKIIFIALFILTLIIIFFICAFIVLFSKDDKKINFASDTIKGLNGFFIGAITGWLA